MRLNSESENKWGVLSQGAGWWGVISGWKITKNQCEVLAGHMA